VTDKAVAVGVEETGGRLWRFDRYEFDELRRSLRVNGKPVDVETKPLDILLQLLLHAGEVVTKEELLESVWPGVMVVDGSLATAVSKLRKAMGDEASPVVTVPRVGYRLAVPVFCKSVAAPADPELHFQPGQFVPGREQWQLVRALEPSGAGEVWIAQNPRTHEQRVFKFASDGVRLRGLKREVTIARFLRESLPERPEFVRILEWNFDTLPYFIESEFAGPNLAEWAEGQGGLANIPAELRLRLFIDIVRAVAAAQGIGVLHKDLKPANILVTPSKLGSGWQIKIADFGSASLYDPARLQALGITNLGFTRTVGRDDDALTGTLMYLAPEVLAGETGSASSDVYALGVLLYQFLVGDFRRPLAAGWEDQIQDPLLREDVAAAAAGDPARRLSTAAELAERLGSIDERRTRRDELESAKLRAQEAERRLAEARARRPWIALALIILVAGLAVSLLLYERARRERDYASRQTAIASSINQFLSDDLLGRSNPFLSGKASESLTDAIKQASPSIDSQFSKEPLIAAQLHQTIARALDNRTDYADALPEYERAAALFRQIQGPSSQDAIIVDLQRANAIARSYQKDSQPLAKSILKSQEAVIAKLDHPRPEIQVWLASARGMIALIDNDAAAAAQQFQAAVDQSRLLPMFDQAARLTFEQRLGFCYIRLGQGAKAEQTFRSLIVAFTELAGPESPNVLRVRLNLAQAFMIENKFADAIRETTAIYPEFVARLGPDHELTMQLLSTRAQSEGSLGLWKDTVRDDMTIYNIAVQKQGPRSFFAAATLSDASLAMCRAGNYTEGESNARKAWNDSLAAFGPQAGLTGGAASTLAACLIGLNRLDEATRLLSGIDVAAVAQLAGDPNWGAGVTLLQAEIAYRQKDFAAARKDVEAIKPVFARGDAEPYQRRALNTLIAALQMIPSS
jgi:DNA-binding winged helix-turn-helix (wHTH) protein/serine/threonine protein kinase